MIYDIRQTTSCTYASPVTNAYHALRQTPVNRPGQRVQVSSLSIEPEPESRREGQDFFGNRLTWVALEEAHATLTVKVSARVAVDAFVVPASASTHTWEAVQEEVFASADIGPMAPAHFLFPSRMVSLDPEIRDYTRQSFPAGRSILEAATELTHRIKTDMTYEVGATTVTTTPPMSFALRRGVCQDFAHIMTALVRHVRIPCRYVSGYVYPRAIRPDRSPEGATHAWIEALLPGLGWVGLDPTNDLLVGERHIRTAIGRDYADVPPTKGMFKGDAASELTVAVRVAPSDAPPPLDAEISLPVEWEPAKEVESVDLHHQQQQQQ